MTDLSNFDGLLDWPRLQAWLATQDLPGHGPITAVEALKGGSQNHLFMLNRGTERIVLRRPPRHLRPNSNDTMLREARVLGALSGSAVPHPRRLAVCGDTEVIGAAFYLMEPLDGFTPIGPLPGRYANDANWRHAIGEELVRAAAALAQIDTQVVGLADFGKPDQWLERQVGRWRSQLEGYAAMEGYPGHDVTPLPHVDAVGTSLERHRPAVARIGLIHGDLQFANVMFRHDKPQLAGLIDWELSSLGDPLLDLGWILTSWSEAGDPVVAGRDPAVQPWQGFMTRAELVQRYGELTGRDMSDMPWFFVLACFKLGCLLEGTYARACAGKAPMAMGLYLHNYAVWLFKLAHKALQ